MLAEEKEDFWHPEDLIWWKVTDPRSKDKISKISGSEEGKYLHLCRFIGSTTSCFGFPCVKRGQPPFPAPLEKKCTADHLVDSCQRYTMVTVLMWGFKPDENSTSKSHNLIVGNKMHSKLRVFNLSIPTLISLCGNILQPKTGLKLSHTTNILISLSSPS